MFETLGDVEVVVRNALHRELSRWSRECWGHDKWYTEAKRFLHPRAANVVTDAMDMLTKVRKPLDGGSIVSHLTFGFWRYLLTKRYQTTLWPAVGAFAFPFLPPGEERNLYRRVDRVLFLRNRIAHHEPIFLRNISNDLTDCHVILGAVHPELATWSRSKTRVPQILGLRPRTVS